MHSLRCGDSPLGSPAPHGERGENLPQSNPITNVLEGPEGEHAQVVDLEGDLELLIRPWPDVGSVDGEMLEGPQGQPVRTGNVAGRPKAVLDGGDNRAAVPPQVI